jgi:hypothetical protein
LLSSLLVLRHALLQQLVPAPHTLLHVPQLLLSEVVSTHAVPHTVGVEPEQATPQLPEAHVAEPVPDDGPGQTFPQLPQLLVSVPSLTHAVPHRFGVGPAHAIPQMAEAHVAEPVPAVGPGHAFPQLAQLAGSLCRLVQREVGPLSRQQSVDPLAQMPSPCALCAGTAGAPTVMSCMLAGLPGGRWHSVTLSPAASVPALVSTEIDGEGSGVLEQAANSAVAKATENGIVVLLSMRISPRVFHRRRSTDRLPLAA